MPTMLVLLLPIALGLFCLGFQSRGNGVRRALLAAMALFGTTVVGISETLSHWRALSVEPVAVSWLIVCIVAAAINWRVIRWRNPFPSIVARLADADVVSLIGLAVILVPTAIL